MHRVHSIVYIDSLSVIAATTYISKIIINDLYMEM